MCRFVHGQRSINSCLVASLLDRIATVNRMCATHAQRVILRCAVRRVLKQLFVNDRWRMVKWHVEQEPLSFDFRLPSRDHLSEACTIVSSDNIVSGEGVLALACDRRCKCSMFLKNSRPHSSQLMHYRFFLVEFQIDRDDHAHNSQP